MVNESFPKSFVRPIIVLSLEIKSCLHLFCIFKTFPGERRESLFLILLSDQKTLYFSQVRVDTSSHLWQNLNSALGKSMSSFLVVFALEFEQCGPENLLSLH